VVVGEGSEDPVGCGDVVSSGLVSPVVRVVVPVVAGGGVVDVVVGAGACSVEAGAGSPPVVVPVAVVSGLT
jgi:hypothetical protein